MSYRIEAGETVEHAVQRVAREQIGKAIREVHDRRLDDQETVHQVRKRCKKLRGLLRLVRPRLEHSGVYERENARYRDAARSLSGVRDAQSVLETLDELEAHYGDVLDDGAFAGARRALLDRREAVVSDTVELRRRLDVFAGRMAEGGDRVADWVLADTGFEALGAGLEKTYARGRRAMRRAYAQPGAERFHEWRKRAKYHLYHVRFVRPLWNAPLKARAAEANRLSDLLGDDHDLTILRSTVMEDPEAYGGEEACRALLALGLERQLELRGEARTLGARLFAEKPKRFRGRTKAYWKAWNDRARAETHGEEELSLASSVGALRAALSPPGSAGLSVPR